ncbi:hypothetical protein [Steroidobacter sp.]|uniref:hypothetical protein n=1 Tax=Steroidobacter sp. TaxID=1978227 RepID=UPI001A3F7C95|nr:hypothetical protein [Steroidobacter sp.]MBL8267260.1 hypothetical protein [Steroidobacter sp.]
MKSVALLIAFICTLSSSNANARAGRPMIIHRLPELNLEIWTEQDPEWDTTLQKKKGGVTFIAETPALTYPPAHMSWSTLPPFQFERNEMKEVARGVLHQMAKNYRTKPPDHLEPRRYGDLTGYEATFSAEQNNLPIDIRMFCGHREGKPPVVMQLVTLKDKLPHLAEHVRRSWTHLKYLD